MGEEGGEGGRGRGGAATRLVFGGRLTVSERMALAVVWPMPKIYCRENSTRFWLGISTPPTRAASILRGSRRKEACMRGAAAATFTGAPALKPS